MVLIEEVGSNETPLAVTVDDPMSLKVQGNDLFRAGKFQEAIEMYTSGLAICEADMRPVLLTNRASSWFHLAEYDQCITDTSEAISLDPRYHKAYFRRALAEEKLGNFASAVEDLEKVPSVDPNLLERIRKLRDDQLEEQKTEMMNSLKSLGNSILGKFGMSTDDFKFEKNPETGSYSVKMNSDR
jgi:tetratricopeptide (TPR) repeat protein